MKKDPNVSKEIGPSSSESMIWGHQSKPGKPRHGTQYSIPANREHENPPGNHPFQQKITDLERQLAEEKRTNQKLLSINQFGQSLDDTPDVERIAQRMSRLLYRLFPCSLVGVYYIPIPQEPAKLLASTGPAATLAPDTLDPDSLSLWVAQPPTAPQTAPTGEPEGTTGAFPAQKLPSILFAPVMINNNLQGVVLMADTSAQAFHPGDDLVLQAAAARLAGEWEHARHTNTLAEFVQSVGNLSMVQETSSLMEIIASIARRTLNASFTVVGAYHHKEWLLHSSGKAPVLHHSLQNGAASFLQAAIKTPYTFRLRDLRTDARSACIQLDSPDLCSLLASPIIINGNASFLLLAFGKVNESGFSDDDVFLADLLSAHAAQNLGSCFVNEKLRHNLVTTQLLNDLNAQFSQVEDLNQAAGVVANIAFQMTHPRACGMVLYSLDGQKEADVIHPAQAIGQTRPYGLIQQAMNSRQSIYLAEGEPFLQVAIPIFTQRRCYGALWLQVEEHRLGKDGHPAEEISTLVSQSTIALERFIFLEETRSQAKKLIQAYNNMEESYDQTLKALMHALDARDRETEGHSERVANLAVNLGHELGLSKGELKALTRGSLLHDIGKIGISDTILLKDQALTEEEWEIMRQHPTIGADIIQEVPALNDALQVIAFHQERWDGSGYPYGLSGKDIPLVARIFAVIDVFDALTTNRPYRPYNLSLDEAARYLVEQAGAQFDPEIVEAFVRMLDKQQQPGSGPDPADLPTCG